MAPLLNVGVIVHPIQNRRDLCIDARVTRLSTAKLSCSQALDKKIITYHPTAHDTTPINLTFPVLASVKVKGPKIKKCDS